jgi:CBS domain-containing protein
MAVLVDGERYAGSLTLEQLGGDLDPRRPATDVALDGPTVAPGVPAKVGQDTALQTEARRVPVVDEDGRLLGVIALTSDLKSFCGTGGIATS